MRSTTDETGRPIEIPDSTTIQEAEVPKEATPTTNTHHLGELEEEEGTMVEAMAKKSTRSVRGYDSNAELMCATFHTTSRLMHGIYICGLYSTYA